MTIEEILKRRIYNNGVFENDVNVIMQRVKADKGNEPMAKRWADLAEDYPAIMIKALWMNVCHHAVEYTDETKPLAWYRQLFVDMVYGVKIEAPPPLPKDA